MDEFPEQALLCRDVGAVRNAPVDLMSSPEQSVRAWDTSPPCPTLDNRRSRRHLLEPHAPGQRNPLRQKQNPSDCKRGSQPFGDGTMEILPRTGNSRRDLPSTPTDTENGSSLPGSFSRSFLFSCPSARRPSKTLPRYRHFCGHGFKPYRPAPFHSNVVLRHHGGKSPLHFGQPTKSISA